MFFCDRAQSQAQMYFNCYPGELFSQQTWLQRQFKVVLIWPFIQPQTVFEVVESDQWSRLVIGNNSTVYTVIYKPPEDINFKCFESYLDATVRTQKSVFTTGDFNIDKLKHESKISSVVKASDIPSKASWTV